MSSAFNGLRLKFLVDAQKLSTSKQLRGLDPIVQAVTHPLFDATIGPQAVALLLRVALIE